VDASVLRTAHTSMTKEGPVTCHEQLSETASMRYGRDFSELQITRFQGTFATVSG
jgi:hypothetical protein